MVINGALKMNSKIGIGGTGNTDPSWIPNGDGITNIPGGN